MKILKNYQYLWTLLLSMVAFCMQLHMCFAGQTLPTLDSSEKLLSNLSTAQPITAESFMNNLSSLSELRANARYFLLLYDDKGYEKEYKRADVLNKQVAQKMLELLFRPLANSEPLKTSIKKELLKSKQSSQPHDKTFYDSLVKDVAEIEAVQPNHFLFYDQKVLLLQEAVKLTAHEGQQQMYVSLLESFREKVNQHYIQWREKFNAYRELKYNLERMKDISNFSDKELMESFEIGNDSIALLGRIAVLKNEKMPEDADLTSLPGLIDKVEKNVKRMREHIRKNEEVFLPQGYRFLIGEIDKKLKKKVRHDLPPEKLTLYEKMQFGAAFAQIDFARSNSTRSMDKIDENIYDTYKIRSGLSKGSMNKLLEGNIGQEKDNDSSSNVKKGLLAGLTIATASAAAYYAHQKGYFSRFRDYIKYDVLHHYDEFENEFDEKYFVDELVDQALTMPMKSYRERESRVLRRYAPIMREQIRQKVRDVVTKKREAKIPQ